MQDLVCTLGNRRKFEEVQRCFDIIGFSHEVIKTADRSLGVQEPIHYCFKCNSFLTKFGFVHNRKYRSCFQSWPLSFILETFASLKMSPCYI